MASAAEKSTKRRAAGSNCASWCRVPTASSMKRNSAASFRAASPSHRDALSGIWPKARRRWPRGDRRRCLAPSVQTSASAAPSRSESRITREERHRRRDAYLAELVAGGAAFRAMTGKEGGSDGVDDAYGQRSKDS